MLKSLIIQSLTERYVKFDLYFIITFYTKDILWGGWDISIFKRNWILRHLKI
jgi:hypothetical protein